MCIRQRCWVWNPPYAGRGDPKRKGILEGEPDLTDLTPFSRRDPEKCGPARVLLKAFPVVCYKIKMWEMLSRMSSCQRRKRQGMQKISDTLKGTKTGKTNQPVVLEYPAGKDDELDLSFHNSPEWLTADWTPRPGQPPGAAQWYGIATVRKAGEKYIVNVLEGTRITWKVVRTSDYSTAEEATQALQQEIRSR
jgi:hypothetical protein